MDESQEPSVERLLQREADAPPLSAEESARVYSLLYDEIRRIAGALMRAQRPGHTLRATEVVNEAFLRINGGPEVRWEGRSQFLALAAKAMRRILVDYARGKGAARRGGDWDRVPFELAENVGLPDAPDAVALHHALEKYESVDERASRVVELRVFAGLTAEETAQVLGVSRSTVDSDWRVAKLWLARQLSA
ncbi:sigma-70 family RNA polymerase sigma factor [bacterium]|nr:sigma-70 family RNA polymerase sigma factor [bacterium]